MIQYRKEEKIEPLKISRINSTDTEPLPDRERRKENTMDTNNSLATISQSVIDTIKDAELRKATLELAKLYDYRGQNNRGICLELWKILECKLYEKGGFKSLNEYAEAINIPDKSRAYKMAETGKVLSHYKAKEDNGTITEKEQEFLDNATATAMHKLAKTDLGKLDSAVNSGEVKADISVEEAAAWARTSLNDESQKRADRKASKVLKRKSLVGYIYRDKGIETIKYDSCIPEQLEILAPFTTAKVKCGDTIVYLGYNPENCEMLRYELGPAIVKEESKKATQKPKFTKEQLLAMLAALGEDSEEDK